MYFISDWHRKDGCLTLGREFSFGIVLFGITIIGAAFYGRLRNFQVMVMGIGFEVQW